MAAGTGDLDSLLGRDEAVTKVLEDLDLPIERAGVQTRVRPAPTKGRRRERTRTGPRRRRRVLRLGSLVARAVILILPVLPELA